jgi:hypothetical protein
MAKTKLHIGLDIELRNEKIDSVEKFTQRVGDFITKTNEYVDNLFNGSNNPVLTMPVPSTVLPTALEIDRTDYKIKLEANDSLQESGDGYILYLPSLLYNQESALVEENNEKRIDADADRNFAIILKEKPTPDFDFFGVDQEINGED